MENSKITRLIDKLRLELRNDKDKNADLSELLVEYNKMIEAIKKTYRKHWMGDDSIGWDELGSDLCTVLCCVMGNEEFVKFAKTAHINQVVNGE